MEGSYGWTDAEIENEENFSGSYFEGVFINFGAEPVVITMTQTDLSTGCSKQVVDTTITPSGYSPLMSNITDYPGQNYLIVDDVIENYTTGVNSSNYNNLPLNTELKYQWGYTTIEDGLETIITDYNGQYAVFEESLDYNMISKYYWVKTCFSLSGDNCFNSDCVTTSYWPAPPTEDYLPPVGINENHEDFIHVYPNPTTGVVYLNLNR